MIYFPIFKSHKNRLFAASTTRAGGVSKGLYSSMNLCHYVGDNREDVAINRHIFCTSLGIKTAHFILPRQTHGDKVVNIDPEFLLQTEEEQRNKLEGVDGLITSEHQICIGISTADCVPILLFDKKTEAIGVVHAGWRGTIARIVTKVIHLMEQTFGTNPQDLIVAIAPCISKENYEVGEELYDIFNKEGFPVSCLFSKHDKTGKFHLDLRETNKWLIKKNSVPEDQIYTSNLCTFENSDTLFSARKHGIHSGRIVSCLMLI